ncbi:MAG: spermidine synthase [Bryobacteraceae bacterium]
MLLYASTIFLSSFLLFQIQPMIAKMILPWFGGSAAVWTTCMLFFQVVLLLGYLYSHWSIERLAPRDQALVHTVLLGLCLLLLPIAPSEAWKPGGEENPTLRILALLAVSIGLPYLLLSTTGPLLQAWYARSERGAAPYRLFAVSNFASMLALLSYPPLVEPYLSTHRQAAVWSAGFAAFAAICIAAGWRSYRKSRWAKPPSRDDHDGEAPERPGRGLHLLWFLLAACASMMLLAVTNYLCQDVASIPFLWIVPLSLYLLTFILCFDNDDWYHRHGFLIALPAALGVMVYLFWQEADKPALKWMLILFGIAFYAACMICHGELARLRPHPRFLTSFYLMVAAGGATGGLLVAVAAPYLFRAHLELPVSILLCAILTLVVLFRDPESIFRGRWGQLYSQIGVGITIVLFGFVVVAINDTVAGYRVVVRNFYGNLRVRETTSNSIPYRSLLHGTITHGEQWMDPERRREPTTYYCDDTGIARAILQRLENKPQRVGVIGLGTGTLVTFGRTGDFYRIYEINPLVLRLARTEFTYLEDSEAEVEVVLGDARLSLEREPDQEFDVLAVDAFSSDAIPVHLLTREAFEVYFRHLREEGILAVHVSNRHLDLRPVVELAAAHFGKESLVVETDDSDDGTCYGTTWILVGNGGPALRERGFDDASPPAKRIALRMWTDDYSNLFQILKRD